MNALIKRLGYIALNVVDLDACVQDAQNVMGLNLVDRTVDRALLTSNARYAEFVLHRATHNAMRMVGLEAYDAAGVDDAARHARKAGMAIVSETPSLPVMERAVTLVTGEGHVIEVHTPLPRNQPLRHHGPGIHPRCIDHVNLAAVDPERIAAELQAVLGLKMSDRTTGHELVWMRAGDGRHHTVGILKGRSGVHHYSWEFSDFADFRRLGDVLDTLDRRISWGPGRHGVGDNIFTYYVDAGGFMVECTTEMEFINEPDFQPRVVDPGQNLSNYRVVNRWGQLPSREWMEHHANFATPAHTAGVG
jgi:catechol 2,3-dioxygenase